MTDSNDRRQGAGSTTISSVKAQPAKGGAGSRNWGSATDVQDFEPVGIPTGSVGVVTTPVAAVTPTSSQVTPTFQMEASAFPVLGATVQPRVVTSWGPATAPAVALDASTLRAGSLDVINSTHPRNLFAKKPTIRTGTTTITAAAPQAIDWSGIGQPEAVLAAINTQTQQQAAAHLRPYQSVATSVPLEVLRTQQVATAANFQQYAPKVDQRIAGAGKPARILQQPSSTGRR